MRATIGPAQGFYFMDRGSPKASEIASLFDWMPSTRAVFERVKTAAEDATETVQGTCTTTLDAAAVFNSKLLEAGRSNSNAALEFTRTIIAVKSPSEFSDLMAGYARKQFELWAQQTREFSDLAQKLCAKRSITAQAKRSSESPERLPRAAVR
jgi:hypothetical protein